MGDFMVVVNVVVKEFNIDIVFVEVLFEDKVVKIEELQVQGKCVVMVGDGVNDVLVLFMFDVGIVIGIGMDVVVEVGDVVFVCSDLCDVLVIIELSKVIYCKMIQNLWWVVGYNIVVIFFVVGVFVVWGILL